MIESMKRLKLPIIVALIYVSLLVFRTDMAVDAFKNSLYYLREMVVILPVIFMLTVAIEVLVPRAWILKRFGENSGFSGNVLSLLLGSVSAGPIYAAFPITKMLLNKGASIGNVVIVLSAWAVVKVPMLANEAKFLGPSFMAVRWVLTVVMIFIMGWVMEKVVKKAEVLASVKAVPAKGDILRINEAYCIGCGVCAKMVPDFYEMKEKKAVVKTTVDISSLNKKQKEAIGESVMKCPASAINYESEA